MRLLLLDLACHPFADDGSPEARRLAARLAGHGAHVDLVTGAPRPAASLPRRRSEDAPETPGHRLRVYAARRGRRRRRRAGAGGAAACFVSTARLARKLLRSRNHDVLHVFGPLGSGALLRLLPVADAVVVVSLREPVFASRLRTRFGRRSATGSGPSRFTRPLARWSWNRADAVVAGCQSLARQAEAVDANGRVDVIRNGVDLELFRPREPEPAAEPPRCLAVGPLVELMGLDDLLHAWARLERGACRLEIAGGGKKETRLRALARRLGVEEDVVFTGPLEPEQIVGRYRAADLFVLCPREAACGIAFARALAAGLPVVASRVGGIPELVGNGVNGYLVPPGDPEAIAAAVRRLAEDGSLRARMATANRARAEELLSWERMGESYERLYRELLDSRRPASRGPLLVRPRSLPHSAH